MCDHLNFTASVNVSRLTDDDDETKIVGYRADIQVGCRECGTLFRFMGIPGGYHPSRPTLNFDGTELRAPIEPSKVIESDLSKSPHN
jgi:hypothetical protein